MSGFQRSLPGGFHLAYRASAAGDTGRDRYTGGDGDDLPADMNYFEKRNQRKNEMAFLLIVIQSWGTLISVLRYYDHFCTCARQLYHVSSQPQVTVFRSKWEQV